MNRRQIAHLTTFRKVQWVLDHHTEALAGINLSFLRARLDQSIGRLEMAAADQAEAATEGRACTAYKNQLRRRLRQWHMQPIITFARADVAELSAMSTYEMPGEHTGDLEFLLAARALARSAGENRDRYVELGMSPDFVDAFRGALDEFDRTLRERDGKEMLRTAATEAMGPEIGVAWELVRLIGALIMSRGRSNSEPITAWRQATLHAPRPRVQAPPEMKLLPAGAPATPGAESGAPAGVMLRLARLFGKAA